MRLGPELEVLEEFLPRKHASLKQTGQRGQATIDAWNRTL
jgi:hypothetical protein